MITAPDLSHLHDDMRLWRRHLHQFPETAFEERATADFIAERLSEFGLKVERDIGKTGVVGVLSSGHSAKKIALRADMDALFIQELNAFPHKSRHDGKMHACGHDGHSAMLLGAAKYLAAHRQFDGTVYFIFQPAEEGRAGAQAMIEDGLFERFPADAVFGLHNFPDIPVGHFAVKSGPMMAAFDCFEIVLNGQATHAAMPHLGNDVILATAHLINLLQSIVSRTVNPADSAVVSITQIHAGNTWNAIPDSAVVRGTFRCFDSGVQEVIAAKIKQHIDAVCAAFGMTVSLRFNPDNPGYPVTYNDPGETEVAMQAAIATVGGEQLQTAPTHSMGSEDFAFMLQAKPGCYAWIGNGSSENSCLLHNPHYDFNDAILPVGAAYWVNLVKIKLG